MKHHDVPSGAIFPDEFRYEIPWASLNQALKTLQEATEWYMVEVIPESHFKCSNQFLVGFQHVS